MSARARRHRNEESARNAAQSATEAAAFSTMAGMMALGLTQEVRASSETPAAEINDGDGHQKAESCAGQTGDDREPGHAVAEAPAVHARPMTEAAGDDTAIAETSATQSVDPVDIMSLAAKMPPAAEAAAAPQQPAMQAMRDGLPPLTGGYEPTMLAPPPATEQPGIPLADPVLAQSLATLATSLEGLNATLQNALQSAPGLPDVAQIAGNVQTTLAEVTATFDAAVGEIGSIRSVEVLSAADGTDALELPAVLPVVTLGETIGFPAIADTTSVALREIRAAGDQLTQSDSATEGLDLLSGIAALPAIGFAGLSYADAVDPYDASHPPAGSIALPGLV